MLVAIATLESDKLTGRDEAEEIQSLKFDFWLSYTTQHTCLYFCLQPRPGEPLLQHRLRRQLHILRARRHKHFKRALLRNPVHRTIIIKAKRISPKLDRHLLLFTWLQLHLGEALKLLRWARERRLRVRDVHLRDLCAHDVARVLDAEADTEVTRARDGRNRNTGVCESGVGEAVPEGEERSELTLLEAAVADVDALQICELGRPELEMRGHKPRCRRSCRATRHSGRSLDTQGCPPAVSCVDGMSASKVHKRRAEDTHGNVSASLADGFTLPNSTSASPFPSSLPP